MADALRLSRYQAADAAAWDDLVPVARQGSFLHMRRFLAYHGDRFEDWSLLFRDGRDRLLGVLPAARDPGDPATVVSHPGLTYAGLVSDRRLRDGGVLAALERAADFYRAAGFRRLVYKPVPGIYHAEPAEDDVYALHRLGARPARLDLGAALAVAARRRTSERRRRALRRAEAAGVTVVAGSDRLEALWPLVVATLVRGTGAPPTHSLAELQWLRGAFPQRIDAVVAMLAGEPVAGTVRFLGDQVCRLQYIAGSDTGYAAGAVDPVVEFCIADATARGLGWIDFGTSTLNGGRHLTDGVQAFKAGFGAGSVVQAWWSLELAAPDGASLIT